MATATKAPSAHLTRFVLVVLVLGTPMAYLLTRALRKPTVLESAYLAAWMLLLLFLNVTLLLTRRQGGLLRTVTGADNRYSTSKLQAAVWTLAIGFGLSLLVALAVFDPDIGTKQLFGEGLQEEYLFLLGPFGAALLAKGVVGLKVREGQLQKYKADAPSPIDVAADDDGKLDLADMQYLLFNLIALAFFLAKLLPSPANGLPDMPPTLIGLTTAATVGYLGNKVVDNNGPVVTSILPSTARSGEKIAIRGHNLFPTGGQLPTVKFDGLPSPNVTVSEGIVHATIPANVQPGPVEVTVVTPAGIETEPRNIKLPEVVPSLPDVPPVPRPTPSAVPVAGNGAGALTTQDDAGRTDGDGDDHAIPAELIGVLAGRTENGSQP